MADVDPSEYDTEQKENVLLGELYQQVLLTETKTTSDEKDDVDHDLDLLNDDAGVNAGNDNEDTPDKKKRHKENPAKEAPKIASLQASRPSSLKPTSVIGAAKAPVKPIANQTQAPPKLIRASKTVPSNVPPRAQINPLPPLTPAPPPPKEVKKEKKEGEFRPRGLAPSRERRSRSQERHLRSGSSRDRRNRDKPGGDQQQQIIILKRDRDEDADLRNQLRRRGHHGRRRPGPGPSTR